MIISYYGNHTLKIQQGSHIIAINPPQKSAVKGFSRFGADIVLESSRHADTSGGSDMNMGQKEPFVISGPGEYEKDGLFIYGVPSETNYKGDKRVNTIYYFSLDDVKICCLGLHEAPNLPVEATELIDEVDVLILPIAGDGVMDPIAAYKLAVKLEPKIIIPVGYDNPKDSNLKSFTKEAEVEVKPVDKITFKKNDLSTVGPIVILENL